MTETIRSYRDHYHVEREDLQVTACVEGGDCEECGRGGQQFYISLLGTGAGGPRKMCEACARRIAGDNQS